MDSRLVLGSWNETFSPDASAAGRVKTTSSKGASAKLSFVVLGWAIQVFGEVEETVTFNWVRRRGIGNRVKVDVQ